MKSHYIKQIVTVLVFLFCLSATATGKQYKIATVAWIGWSPLHVALKNGYWDELGLDVDVITYDDPIVILEAIKAGRIDFAMNMVGDLVGVFMKGEPIVAIAETNWSHGGDKIVVRKGYRLENNIGDVIGVFLHQPSCLYFLGQYLKDIHLKLSDFRIVEINSRDLSAQFIAKRLPAIVNYEPWVNEAVAHGSGVVLATSADYKGCIPECLWAYQQTIDNIPTGDIHKLLRGWIKAVVWLKDSDNLSEYFKILKEYTFLKESGLTDEDFSKMLGAVRIHDLSELKERNEDMGGLTHYLSSLKSFLKKNNRLEKDYSPETIFDNRYIMHVLKADSKLEN